MSNTRLEERLKSATSGAYLFVGPPGVGKSLAALRLASAMLCPESCETCEVCRRISAGLHPDVHMFEPEGYTYPVETIRDMVTSAARSPIEAKSQVFIINEAHLIAERSQNALLKALEEPNPSVTWVLVGAALDLFLPTILSRCEVIEFAAMSDEALLALLPGPDAALTVRVARGDASRAMSLAGDGSERDMRRLALDVVTHPELSIRSVFADIGKLSEIVSAIKSETEKVQAEELKAFDEATGSGRGSAGPRKQLVDSHKRGLRRAESQAHISFLGWLGDGFRDLAVASSGSSEEALIATDRTADLTRASTKMSPYRWLEMVEASANACNAIRENANATMAVESVLLRLQSNQSAGVAQMAEQRFRKP